MNALTVKNLFYRYPSGEEALRGVDLEIPRGSKTALVGKNGSGKTTLLLHVNGLLDGDGYIEVMGIVRGHGTIAQIREKTGFLFGQTEYHFIMTDLLRDVMLGIVDETLSLREKRERAMEWLAFFGLERHAYRSPLELSTGEMKRAALVGVLAKKPELLMLDEPLNGLDRESADNLVLLLGSLPVTIIMATHRLFLVETLATHVAVMEDGIVTQFLPVKNALKHKDVRALLY